MCGGIFVTTGEVLEASSELGCCKHPTGYRKSLPNKELSGPNAKAEKPQSAIGSIAS